MTVSYQSKHRVRRVLRILAVILAVLLLFCICRFFYLQRFLVYDETGVHLDYGGQPQLTPDETPPSLPRDELILIQDGTVGTVEGTHGGGLAAYKGVYITAGQLIDEEFRASVADGLSNANTVMLDMKTSTGKFLYNTAIAGADKANTDLQAIETLISQLTGRSNLTVIARVPAFQDSAYALTDYSQSLAIKNGALWIDQAGSYWLDPAGKDVPDYLISTARELVSLGFDEVVFDNFQFPKSDYIHYTGEVSGLDAAYAAAQNVRQRLATFNIPVSFISDDIRITTLSHRAYIAAQTGNQVLDTVKTFADFLGGDDARLVFLTASHDTRFNPYSILAPFAGQ